MGKKAKEHRKKVQKRNELLKLQQKKLMADLQKQFQEQMAARAKAAKPLSSSMTYATTGNPEELINQGNDRIAQKMIETQDDGPKFR